MTSFLLVTIKVKLCPRLIKLPATETYGGLVVWLHASTTLPLWVGPRAENRTPAPQVPNISNVPFLQVDVAVFRAYPRFESLPRRRLYTLLFVIAFFRPP
jgi:hypothetical protein